MKRKNILMLICCIVCLVGQIQGCSNAGKEEAVSAYKHFMDYWIVGDYTRALPHASGDAVVILEDLTLIEIAGEVVEKRPGGYGTIEASKIMVLSDSKSDNKIDLEVVYSASISYPGSTANPMSPGSWDHFEQKVTMEKVGNLWKVADFSGQGIDDA